MEIWKDIQGYEGLYQVSSLGRIKSVERTVRRRNNTTRIVPEIILATIIQSRGYVVVTLSKEDKQKRFRVSRIVANHFVPNPNGLPEVNHEDTNKLNNLPSNLKWCTRQYNIQHGYDAGLKMGRKKLNQLLS